MKIADKIYPTAKLPSTPKYIAQLAALKLSFPAISAEQSRFLRRLLTVSINGGVAVDLLESSELFIENVQVKAKHFSRTILHLCNSEVEDSDLLRTLNLPIGNLLHYLTSSSNEASYCGLFWNLVLNGLFRFGEGQGIVPNHRLEQEWNTRRLYSEKLVTFRKIDLVALIEFGSKSTEVLPRVSKKVKTAGGSVSISIPMLTVEASKYEFSTEEMHKDFGKTLGLISANCVTLAHKLVAMGKKPEEAKVYGILIGGTNIQLCTAHAVVTKVLDNSGGGNNNYEIHANLTFDDHWFMNVFDSSFAERQRSCTLPCCAPTQMPGFESIQAASSSVDLSRAASYSRNFATIEIPEDADVEVDPDPATGTIKFGNHPVNLACLKKLKAFVDCIKARIDLLKSSSDSIMDESGRNYLGHAGEFYFSQGNIQKTPMKHVPSERPTRYISNRNSTTEHAIYCECAAYYPLNFPRIYSITIQHNPASFQYEFEKMIPFQRIITDCLNQEHSLTPMLKFAIDCLSGLNILHEKIGIIHCDISPGNVMFSEVDEMFKIFDFDLSIKKANEAVMVRPGVGTKDFIAPESEFSGIYREASDVYSLGMVIFSELVPIIVQINVDEEESNEYIRTVAGMIQPEPQKRLSVLEALREFIYLSDRITPSSDFNMLQDSISRAKLILLWHAGEDLKVQL